MGQGIATTLAQLVVDVFGVPIEKVHVVLGDTDRGDGFGSAGSRSLFTGGSALQIGAESTLDQARNWRRRRWRRPPATSTTPPAGSVAGTDLGIDLFELAGKQAEQRIHVEAPTAVSGPSWPNGCHVSEVEIDPRPARCRWSPTPASTTSAGWSIR